MIFFSSSGSGSLFRCLHACVFTCKHVRLASPCAIHRSHILVPALLGTTLRNDLPRCCCRTPPSPPPNAFSSSTSCGLPLAPYSPPPPPPRPPPAAPPYQAFYLHNPPPVVCSATLVTFVMTSSSIRLAGCMCRTLPRTVVRWQVILDPRVWRKEEGAPPRRREPVECIKRDLVEALLQVMRTTCTVLTPKRAERSKNHLFP